MKALTVRQPWASMLALGIKPWEFRGWLPPQQIREGAAFAIHAGLRFDAPMGPARRTSGPELAIPKLHDLFVKAKIGEIWDSENAAEILNAKLPRGVLAIVRCEACVRTRGAFEVKGHPLRRYLSWPGLQDHQWAWRIKPLVELVPPTVGLRGRLGFWDLPPEISAVYETFLVEQMRKGAVA